MRLVRALAREHDVAVGLGFADSYHDELWRSYRQRGVKLLLMLHAWDADPVQ